MGARVLIKTEYKNTRPVNWIGI